MKQIHSIFSSGLQCYYHEVVVQGSSCRPSAAPPTRPLFTVVVNHPPFPAVTGGDAHFPLRRAVLVAVLLLGGRWTAVPF